MLDDIDLEIPEEFQPEDESQDEKPARSRFLTLVGILAGILVIGVIAIGLYAFFVLPQRQAAQQEQAANETATALVQFAQEPSSTPTLFPTATDTPGGVENLGITQTVQALLTEAAVQTNTPPSATPTTIPSSTSSPEATTTVSGATQTVQALLTQAAEANGDVGGGGEEQVAQAQATDEPTAAPTEAPTADSTGPTQTVESLLTQAAESQSGDATSAPADAATPTLVATPTATPSALPDTGFADEVNPPMLMLATAMLLLVVGLSRGLRRRLT